MHRRAVLLSAACAAAAWAGPATGARRVVVLGEQAQGLDASWRSFSGVWQRRVSSAQPQLQPPVQLLYAPVSLGVGAEARLDLEAVARQQPTLVVATTGDSALVARQVLPAVPLIFSSYLDPVAAGLARSLRSAGPGLTGISLADTLDAKRLELLRDAFPGVRRVAVLAGSYPGPVAEVERQMLSSAAALGLQAQVLWADTAAQLDALMHSRAASAVQAWYVPPTYVGYVAEKALIGHLRRLQLPAIHATEGEVAQGALMAYAHDTSFVWETLVDLTVRVLRGEEPGTIPVQRPRRFVLAVRPRAEPAVLRIHPAVVRRADRIY